MLPFPGRPAPAGRATQLGAALAVLFAVPALLVAASPASAEPVPSAEPVASVERTGWMAAVPDDTDLAALSVPGTHDSGAWHGTVWSRTQDLTISEQLDSGVRFLDVRTRHYRDAFPIHHGAEYLHLNFTDVVTDVSAFLSENPTETVLMRLKKEHTEEENTRSYRSYSRVLQPSDRR